MTAGPSTVVNISTVDWVSKVIALSGGVCLSQETDDEAPHISESCFMTWSLDITPKTTEHSLTVCIGKSGAEVTNNKRLRSRYCTVEANYRQTRKHRAASLRHYKLPVLFLMAISRQHMIDHYFNAIEIIDMNNKYILIWWRECSELRPVYSDATQLNSTSSWIWVELCRYKRAFICCS